MAKLMIQTQFSVVLSILQVLLRLGEVIYTLHFSWWTVSRFISLRREEHEGPAIRRAIASVIFKSAGIMVITIAYTFLMAYAAQKFSCEVRL